jgi:hypothetical protein
MKKARKRFRAFFIGTAHLPIPVHPGNSKIYISLINRKRNIIDSDI